MKSTYKFILIAVVSLLSLNLSAQQNFKWDVIIDSIEGSKQELYLKTKLFIAETWVSSKDVIQNDDSISGIILVRGVSKQTIRVQTINPEWHFSYDVKFMIKDGKCRIIINNVHCTYARAGTFNWPILPVQDEYPTEKPWLTTNLTEKNYLKLMGLLKLELNLIALTYKLMLVTEPKKLQDW